MPLTLRLAYRYLRGSSGFITVVIWTAIIGMALGTALLITVLSVMNGFERELKARILGNLPHIIVSNNYVSNEAEWANYAQSLQALDNVQGVAPYREGFALLLAGRQQTPVYLIGIDPLQEHKVSDVHNFLSEGVSLSTLQPGAFNIILGDELADGLGVHKGDDVVLVLEAIKIV